MNNRLSDHDPNRLGRMIRGEQESWNGAEISPPKTLVHNLRGTNDCEPPTGFNSWKEWWEHGKGRNFGSCSCFECETGSAAHDGAHVQMVNGGDEWYIVPLCPNCHQSKRPPMQFNVHTDDLLPINP